MGQRTSKCRGSSRGLSSEVVKPPTRQSFLCHRVLKKVIKRVKCQRRKKHAVKISNLQISVTSPTQLGYAGDDVIITTAAPDAAPLSTKGDDGINVDSRHSLLSYALSKLAFFAQLSKQENSVKDKTTSNRYFFHKSMPARNQSGSRETAQQNLDESRNKNLREQSESSQDLSKNLTDMLVQRILSRKTKDEVNTYEEAYEKNLKKFDKLVAVAFATSSSSNGEGHDTDSSFEVKYDGSVPKQRSQRIKSRRIIPTSKTRVKVDANFVEWMKNEQASRNAEKRLPRPSWSSYAEVFRTPANTSIIDQNNNSPNDMPDENNNPKIKPHEDPSYQAGILWKKGSHEPVNKGDSTKGKGKAKKGCVEPKKKQKKPNRKGKKGPSSASSNSKISSNSKASSRSKRKNRTRGESRRDLCRERRGSCGGKTACVGGAPPAYLDYGGVASTAGASRRSRKDPVMERLKNVDVIEELTYMVPNECGGGDDCESDEFDYYAVCESCGEMEPLADELKPAGCKKGIKETPVTYSRRQRFNFKNKNEMGEDEEGPPYPIDGLLPGETCRCPCCQAGLRRNPNCGCNCCQTGGPARKCNSFDETPVGKNPQIRRILCPEEICQLKREARDKIVPEASGMYNFDQCTLEFERQVPRTATPIILEVPVPRRLNQDDLEDLTVTLANKRRHQEMIAVPPPPAEAEPMYLPPIYGQCANPGFPPCGGIMMPQPEGQRRGLDQSCGPGPGSTKS